jgi:Cys-tRNA(Pro)/Cys-tRNA(Cys) deacylase
MQFSLVTYEPGDEHVDAETIAARLGISPDIVFKTLVARDESSNIVVFCLPGNAVLNLKKAAKAAGAKSMALIKLTELFPLTGYVRGGCSPVGMKKKYPVIIDETALLYDVIYVNGGSRGIQMQIAPGDLAKACEAIFEDIVA